MLLRRLLLALAFLFALPASAQTVKVLGRRITPAATCGNNVKETGEVCDGTDLSGASCSSLGYASGTLACSGDCLSYNVSSCGGVTDNFDTDPFASRWIRDYGGTDHSYDATNHEVDFTAPGTFMIAEIRNSLPLAGDNGHACVIMKNWSDTTTGPSAMAFGLGFRGGASAGSAKYSIEFRTYATVSRVFWKQITGQTANAGGYIQYSESCGSNVSGDNECIDWTGTGAGTTIRVWHNPAGAYGSWGSPACTFVDCGAFCVDSGRSVSLISDESSGTSSGTYDTYSGSSP